MRLPENCMFECSFCGQLAATAESDNGMIDVCAECAVHELPRLIVDSLDSYGMGLTLMKVEQELNRQFFMRVDHEAERMRARGEGAQ